MSAMETMPVKRDADGRYLDGWAIAFSRDGLEGVLMAGSLEKLKALLADMLVFPADWANVKRVELRPKSKTATATQPERT